MDLIPQEEKSSVNKKTIFIGVGILVLVAVAALLIFGNKNAPPTGGANNGGGNATGTTDGEQVTKTYAPISGDVNIPDVNSQVDSGVANPTEVKQVGTNNISERDFSIVLDKDAATPQKVIVKLLDIVTINFSAIDKTYDMTQPDNGLSWTVPKGGAKSLQFQGSTPGQFTFYCVSCGGPDKGPVGYIVVVPK